MARQVFPLIGGIVGGIFGGPAGAQAGFAIGSLIGNAVDPQIIKGPSIGDGQTTTSQEGKSRPIIWGTGCVGGNIIARGELIKRIKKQKQGKGGPVTEEERFFMTYAIRISEGPIDGVVRIWEDETLVLDLRQEGSQVSLEENQKYSSKFRLYLGGEDQLPDPDLESIFGVGDTPSYRGSAYIVFPNRDLTDRRGSVPSYRFEVSTSATSVLYPDIFTAIGRRMFVSNQGSLEYIGLHDPSFGGISDHLYPRVSADGMFLINHGSLGSSFTIHKLNLETGMFDIPIDTSMVPNMLDAILHQDSRTVAVSASVGGYMNIMVYRINTSTNSLDHIKTTSTGIDMGGAYEKIIFNESGSRFIILCGLKSVIANFDSLTGTLSSISAPGRIQSYSYKFTNHMNGSILFSSLNNMMTAYKVNPDNSFSLAGSFSYPTSTNENGASFISKTGGSIFVLVRDTDGYGRIMKLVWQVDPLNPNLLIMSESGDPVPHPTNYKISTFAAAKNFGLDPNKNMLVLALEDPFNSSEFRAIVVYKILDNDIEIVFEGIPIGTPNVNSKQEYFASPINSSSIVTGSYDVSSIIQDISDRLHIDLNKVNVDDIDELQCQGLVAAEQYSGGNVIRKLQEAYFFDNPEYDGKINFLLRGKPVVESISYDQTVLESYEFKRKSVIEYPRKIEMLYQNPKVGYAVAKAVAQRISPDVNVSGTQTVNVPVTLDENEAAQISDKMHKVAWAEAEGEYNFSLDCSYDYLTPGDCIGFFTDSSLNLNSRSSSYRLRIEKMETADGIINLTAMVDRQTAYVSSATGIPLPTPTPPPSTIVGPTTYVYLDIPALVDAHDLLGYYNSGVGLTSSWSGAQHQRADVTNDFVNFNTIGQGLLVGEIMEDIHDASEHYSDTTNYVHVKFPHNYDEPQAVTQDQLLQEQNAFAIQRPDGSGEIMQFRDVEDLGNNEYKLSYLIRGRLNSGTSSHSAGAKFVLLEDSFFVSVNSSLIGRDLQHRAVSFGQDVESATVYTYEYVGRSQIEFPVDLLTVELVGSDAHVAWSPRERFGTDINPVRSVNWSNYKITYTDGTLTESFDTLTPEHTLDVSAYSGTLTVTVFQVNRITGDGPGVSQSIAL